ncbi:MAG: hypothetical protein DHS20C11_10690 [Lysobacteraceae bacterium]|nr:MAG: hypothetical protein DHS20C11_10690 [Xanthomonadaceae bacterium]
MYSKASSPQSIGGLLDDAFKLYRAAFSKVIGISAMSAGLALIPLIVVFFLPQDPTGMTTFWVAMVVTYLLFAIVGSALLASMVLSLHSVHIGQPQSVSACLKGGTSKLWAVLLASILYGLAVAGGALLLLIPGIIFMLSLALYSIAIVVDDTPGSSALGVSHRLVWGNWWRTAAVLGVMGILWFVLVMMIGFVAGVAMAIVIPELDPAVDSMDSMFAIQFVFNLLQQIIQALVAPLMYGTMVVMYHDLKMRKEGIDLEARIDSLETA